MNVARRTDQDTLNSLVALKDLGLDPASKQARKMIDRIDKRLVFKWLNNRPYFQARPGNLWVTGGLSATVG